MMTKKNEMIKKLKGLGAFKQIKISLLRNVKKLFLKSIIKKDGFILETWIRKTILLENQ